MRKALPKQGGVQPAVDGGAGPPEGQEEQRSPAEGLPQQQVDQILQAITATRDALHADIAQVTQSLGLLRADHSKLVDRVKKAETALEDLEPAAQTLTNQMAEVQHRLRHLEQRAEDAEGRNRRNNIRVVGLPEGVEGKNMLDYLETWLRTVVAPEGLTPFYTLERAHRVPARPLAPGRPPRPVIAKLLHYKDRDWLLAQARAKGPYKVDNASVTIFPDYTLEVQRKRASYLAVKKALREEGLQYALMFPAKLKVLVEDKSHFHSSPEEAWDWLERYRSGAEGQGTGWTVNNDAT